MFTPYNTEWCADKNTAALTRGERQKRGQAGANERKDAVIHRGWTGLKVTSCPKQRSTNPAIEEFLQSEDHISLHACEDVVAVLSLQSPAILTTLLSISDSLTEVSQMLQHKL